MMITVKEFFGIRLVLGGAGETTLELERAPINRVIDMLSERYGSGSRGQLLDPATHQVRPGIPILVNGRHSRHYLLGLDSQLVHGDCLALFPAVARG